ncbi:MAG: ATP-grasp domain-containing protein [Candidatus Hydrothermarchaeales archaeon]
MLIGIHTRPAVFSAKALDLFILSVDYFGDVDLKEAADLSRSIRNQEPYKSSGRISENYSSERLAELAKDLDADYTILTSSANIKRRVVGNPLEKVIKLKDKEFQLKKVKRLGINVPEFEVVKDRDDAMEAAENLGFPCVLKPVRGAGGRDVILAKTADDVPEIEERYIVQRYAEGMPISTSTLSTKNDSILLSTSEQILGSPLLGQVGFVYCGSITPLNNLEKKGLSELEDISVKVSKAFRVVGWNGIDFVADKEPVFIEINPRFQGTFDCIERSYNINLLDAHVRACERELIESPIPTKTTVRMTLFAKERCIVNEDLQGLAVDVPLKNSIIEKGEPVTTIITSGTREEAVSRCKNLVKRVYERSLLP